MSLFTARTYHNEYLPIGAGEIHAIVAVSSSTGATPATPPPAAEIVILDVSGSMTGAKLEAAKEAAAAAIDCLPDGTAFAVVAGHQSAACAYPGGGELALASQPARGEARTAIAALQAGGRTAIGTWVALAGDLLDTHIAGNRHAILLTDGQNLESAAELDLVLDACEGRFQCDCRGVGTDWKVSELRRIASALLGSVDIVADPDHLAADFRAMVAGSMARQAGDVSLRVWTPRSARVGILKQVAPAIEDLTGRARDVDGLTVDYPTGAWGSEMRDYHVSVVVPARGAGERMLAARLSVVVAGTVVADDLALVTATWTNDERLSTRIDRQLARYTGQAELAGAIQDGLEALESGDDRTATGLLGEAVRLATETGNDATLRLLEGVVDVEDPVTGTVRLKRLIDAADAMALDVRSTRTARVSEP